MRVGIVGIGQTKFDKSADSSSWELDADAFKEQAPYFLGPAELKEGPEAFAWIDKQIQESQIRIGMKMRLRISKLPNANLIYTLKIPE
jgi:uncharacterized OB-fold protein